MSKRDIYEPLARQYYVESQMPVSGISKRLQITEKTLHVWRKEGKWDEQRTSFLRSQFSCYGSLYELVKLLADDIKQRYITEGALSDRSTLRFLTDMVDRLQKLKDFEETMCADRIESLKSEESGSKSNPLSEIDKFLKGI